MSWDTKEPSIVGDSRPITPGVSRYESRRRKRTEENPFGLRQEKRKRRKASVSFCAATCWVWSNWMDWFTTRGYALTQTHPSLCHWWERRRDLNYSPIFASIWANCRQQLSRARTWLLSRLQMSSIKTYVDALHHPTTPNWCVIKLFLIKALIFY